MEFKFLTVASVIASVILVYAAGFCLAIEVDDARVQSALKLAKAAQESIDAATLVKGTCTNEAALRWWSEGKDLETVRGKLCGIKLNPKLKQ